MPYKIKISEDFSSSPAGRFYSDGPNSGERFREELLLKALRDNDVVVVDLSGVYGYGSSFLEEAFGGLVRKGYFDKNYLKDHLEIRSSLSTYLKKIWKYIDEAKKE